MVNLIPSFGVALAILLAYSFPYLSNRVSTVSILFNNHPDKLPELNLLPNPSIKFTKRIRNCEDALIVEGAGVALLSCDPGRDRWNTVTGTFHPDPSQIPNGKLWVYRYSRPESEQTVTPIKLVNYPGNFSFHPLGIDYHEPSGTLFVVNHHLDGSRLDIFSLDLSDDALVARHTNTVLSPLVNTPNAITALNDHEFYVTNDHALLHKDHPWLHLVETYLAYPGGNVAYVDTASDPPLVRTVAHVPFANGVTLLNNSKQLAVASPSTAQVRLYDILDDRSLEESGRIDMNFMPDNLSTDADGVLLMAGPSHPPTLDNLVHVREKCIREKGMHAEECWKADSPTTVAQWTREKGVEELYVSRSEFGSGSTAVRDVKRGFGLVSGLYEAGILVWRSYV